MKFLNSFTLFKESKFFSNYDNFEEVEEEIVELELILKDLIDDFWWVKIDFIPKRWSQTYSSDQISVMIKKKQCESGSIYHKDSDFQMQEVEEVKRILNIYYHNNMEIRICLRGEPCYSRSNDLDGSNVGPSFFYGYWETITKEELELKFKKDISIFGIYIFIYLETENIDLQKKNN